MATNVLSSMDSLQIDIVDTANFPKFFKACNGTYFLAKKQVTITYPAYKFLTIFSRKQQQLGFLWEEAYAECCAFGFKPTSFETDVELKCVADFMKCIHK